MSIVYIGTGLYQTIIYTKNCSIVAHIRTSMGNTIKRFFNNLFSFGLE